VETAQRAWRNGPVEHVPEQLVTVIEVADVFRPERKKERLVHELL